MAAPGMRAKLRVLANMEQQAEQTWCAQRPDPLLPPTQYGAWPAAAVPRAPCPASMSSSSCARQFDLRALACQCLSDGRTTVLAAPETTTACCSTGASKQSTCLLPTGVQLQRPQLVTCAGTTCQEPLCMQSRSVACATLMVMSLTSRVFSASQASRLVASAAAQAAFCRRSSLAQPSFNFSVAAACRASAAYRRAGHRCQ